MHRRRWSVARSTSTGIASTARGPSPMDMSACAYPSHPDTRRHPLIAPALPGAAGARLRAVARIGHADALSRRRRPVGPYCNRHSAPSAPVERVSVGALRRRCASAYVCWLDPAWPASVLWLRATGRGRGGVGTRDGGGRRWRSCHPSGCACKTFFHPQDLIALGLGLAAMACARRDRGWRAAGVLIARSAVLSQQFAVLMAMPLSSSWPRQTSRMRVRRLPAVATVRHGRGAAR